MDSAGRLVTCEQSNRRVTRTEVDGTVVTVAEQWQGHRFNSPNVVIERRDGLLYFSHPSYGIDSDYEGRLDRREIDRRMVFCHDPDTGDMSLAVDHLVVPNGLAFDLDERSIYVVDCGPSDVGQDGALSHQHVLAHGETGPLDSLTVDHGGRVWAAAGEGVDCYHPDGIRLARLRLPEPVANLTFGGSRGNDCSSRRPAACGAFA